MADAEAMLAELAAVRLGQVDGWVQLALVDLEDGALIGDCASRVMSQPPRTAEIGVTLAPGRQGRGFAGEALRRLVRALFEDHDVRRVIAEVDDRDTPGQRLLDRLGVRLEARFVDADWFNGEWTTLRVYVVIAGEMPA